MRANEKVLIEVSADVRDKLCDVKDLLKVDTDDEALDQTLNMAHFIKNALDERSSKVLIETKDRYVQLKGFA